MGLNARGGGGRETKRKKKKCVKITRKKKWWVMLEICSCVVSLFFRYIQLSFSL